MAVQVWTLEHDGATHRVEASGSTTHHVEWFVDGELRGSHKTLDDRVTVTPADGAKDRLVVRGVRIAVNIPWPDIPWPDLPDLPSIPWPDVPLPDVPDVTLPAWVRWTLDKVKYVWPIVFAYGVARAEIKRRRREQERRSES